LAKFKRSAQSSLSKAVLSFLVGCVVIGNGCTNRGVHQILRQDATAPHAYPKVLAVYMPWFGEKSHIGVGYSSHDPEVITRQISEARSMGISGFVVDWYGDRDQFVNQSFAIIERTANQQHFQVALLYNEPADDNGEATDETLAALGKAYASYIGPSAPDRAAYLTYQGHPVIFIFPKGGHTNWNVVRQQVNTWDTPPLLFYKDGPPHDSANSFAGYYAWVHPGRKGWAADGSDWGEQYLETFYKSMKDNYPGKIAVGAAWPGFNDALASWGLNRHMDARCGSTFEKTLRLYHQYYDDANPLPFLLVETWNDYEEGTAIERPDITGCKTSVEVSSKSQPSPVTAR
jgi:hypothetical protein